MLKYLGLGQMDDVASYPREGGCQCGAVRYEIQTPPRKVYVCHCRECQRQSASAFGISVRVPSKDFRLKSGEPRRWTRATDSGGILTCNFCPVCGSRVWHGDLQVDDTISVKGGSLDMPVNLSDASHIWTSRALRGVIIPERTPKFLEEPDE